MIYQQPYERHRQGLLIIPGNIFVDTNRPDMIAEYSVCLKYFRIVRIDATVSRWVSINNKRLRYSRNNTYTYTSTGNIWVRFGRL